VRARNIKPGFFKNEELAAKDPLARILFQGLWCMADREGRLEDRPARIKAEILPYDACDAESLLASLALGEDPFILRYESEGRRFIQIVHFGRHQNPHLKEPKSTIPAPGRHDADNMPEPEKHQAGTVQAPEENHADTVQAPYGHGASPADILIPDSLIPDSLNSLSEDKQPPAPLSSSPTETPPPEKKLSPKGNHFLSHIKGEKLRGEIKEAVSAIDPERFNAYQWCQAKFSEKKFNPGAVLHTLQRIAKEHDLKMDLWPYANKIYEVEYGKFNERDYIEGSREYRRDLSQGEIVRVGAVLSRLAKPP
jgi:hypothetical protein